MDFDLPKAKASICLYEAYYSPKEVVNLRESIGRISASFVIPYPPGVPLLCPGELISPELVEYIEFANQIGIEIIGLISYNKEKIEVVK